MEKYFKGFLAGCVVIGIIWFMYGRPDINRIDRAYNTVDRDFKTVQQSLSTVTTDSNGLTGDISEIAQTSKRIENRSGTVRDRLTEVDGSIRSVAGEVDKLEDWNRQIIIIGRELGEVSADLRKYNR